MKNNNSGCVWVTILVLFFAVVFIIKLYISFGTQESVTAHVIRAERVNYSKSGVYLVFTDNETFCIKDNWLLFRCNSSDDYGRIESGKTYNFLVCGFRIPFFSMYRNILKIEVQE